MSHPFHGVEDPAFHTVQPAELATLLDPVMATQAELETLAAQVSALSPFQVGPPTVSSVTLNTAFQPRANGPCCVSVLATITSLVSGGVTVSLQMCPTQSGTYTEVGVTNLITLLTALSNAKETLQVPVPTGYWLKVVATGGTPTVTKVVWNLT